MNRKNAQIEQILEYIYKEGNREQIRNTYLHQLKAWREKIKYTVLQPP
jgi:predicted transcriptional regulator